MPFLIGHRLRHAAAPFGLRLNIGAAITRAARRPRLRLALAAVILGTSLAGCGPDVSQRGAPDATGPGVSVPPGDRAGAPPGPPRDFFPGIQREVRVALLVPLSGPHKELGSAMLNAAELALEDAGNDNLVLMPKDTRGAPETAAAVAGEAIDEGAQLILGPLLSASVRSVHPVASAAGVRVISFSSDESVAGDGTFVMGFLPRDQVQRVVSYAASLGRFQFAVLAPDTPYGRLVAEETGATAREHGASLVKVAFYDPNAPDVTPTVRYFANYDSRTEEQKESGEGVEFDAVMLPEGGLKLLEVAPLLPFFDVDPSKVQYLGTGLWDAPVVHREPNLVGGLFAAPPPDARQDFVSRYEQSFGQEPPRLATLAYDATALAALLARAPGGPDFSAAAIGDANGFTGADGLMRFTPEGTVERGLAVLQVKRNGFSVVSPARTSFQAALN